MGGPGSLLPLLLLLGGAESRSHTLRYFLTAVSEPSPGLPEFTVAGYVDGQRFVEYDGEAQQMRPRAPWMQAAPPEAWERENHVHKVRQACFRGKVRSHQHLYNQSRGFHIFQYAYGCEIQADGGTGGFRRFGFDGGDFLVYDAARHRWEAPAREAEATQRRWNADPVALQYYRNFLELECLDALRRYLRLGRGALARREPQSDPLLIPAVAGVILAVGAAAVLVALVWKRRQRGPKAELYSQAPASDSGSDSSISGGT